MSTARARHAATMNPPPRNDRREYLSELYAALRTHPELAAGLVERRGVSWVSVVRYGGPRRPVEIGCDFRDGTWWFCWSADAHPIAPAHDIPATVATIAQELATAPR